MPLSTLLLFLALLAATASLSSFYGKFHWLLDLISNFQPIYAAVAVGCALWLAVMGMPLEACAGLISALPALLVMKQRKANLLPEASKGIPLRVLSFNVYAFNHNDAAILELIRNEKPDLFCILEITSPMLHALSPLHLEYPSFISDMDENAPDRRKRSGIALFSRYPLHDSCIRTFGNSPTLTATANIQLSGRTLQIVATHPFSPRNSRRAASRNSHLAELADWLHTQTDPTLVMGDFNLTSGSGIWRRFLRDSGMRHAGKAVATFPSSMPLIEIDHILGSKEISRRTFRTGKAGGSDHLPVIADIVIN